MFRSILHNGLALLLMCLLGLVFTLPALSQDEIRFTKYNIHTQSKNGVKAKASYANYTDPGVGHVVVPAGTEIDITKQSRKGFVFTYDNGSKKVTFEYHDKRMGMSIDEYIEKITSSQPVSYNKFSKKDKKGLADGKAYAGMTRKGVLAALGYPATHRTPSLDEKTWVYWTNRFKTIAVEFDGHGKVLQVRR